MDTCCTTLTCSEYKLEWLEYHIEPCQLISLWMSGAVGTQALPKLNTARLTEECCPPRRLHRPYAGDKGGYSFFAGNDASRAYLTGKFQDDLNDDVEDFTDEQFHGLMHWKEFYLKVLLLSYHGVSGLHHKRCDVF